MIIKFLKQIFLRICSVLRLTVASRSSRNSHGASPRNGGGNLTLRRFIICESASLGLFLQLSNNLYTLVWKGHQKKGVSVSTVVFVQSCQPSFQVTVRTSERVGVWFMGNPDTPWIVIISTSTFLQRICEGGKRSGNIDLAICL